MWEGNAIIMSQMDHDKFAVQLELQNSVRDQRLPHVLH